MEDDLYLGNADKLFFLMNEFKAHLSPDLITTHSNPLLVANLDPSGSRRGVPDDLPEEVLRAFPLGLTTQEVAEVMRTDIEEPINRRAAAQSLIRAVGRGTVVAQPLGDDGLWRAV